MTDDVEMEEQDIETALHLRRRHVTEAQFRRFEAYMAEIFTAFGMDVDTPSTHDTPRRFVKAMFDVTEGYEGDPKVMTVFRTECHGGPDCELSQIIEGPIQVYGLCEHHALPVYGHAYVAYIAHEHILGISKLTRVVRIFSKRFTVQERVGQQIADALNTMLQPHGVAVYLEAYHSCTQMRGVRETAPMTRTSFWRGAYETNPALRTEFLATCGLQR